MGKDTAGGAAFLAHRERRLYNARAKKEPCNHSSGGFVILCNGFVIPPAILCYFMGLLESTLKVDKTKEYIKKGDERMRHGHLALPEGLDEDLYGHLCPEIDWLTNEELERLLDGEKELREYGLAE